MNRLRRLLSAACLAAAACLAVAATAQPSDPRAAPTRQITDAAGRVVTLPATVNRVADAWHANNSTVLMLGGASKLVATTVQARKQPWLQRLYPRIESLPAAFNAAGEVNVETLIGARPDVILMAYDGSLPKWFDTISPYPIAVVLMPNTSLEDLATTARLTGQVLGERESRVAADYVRYFEGNIHRVRQITDRLAPSERPKVLHTSSAGILTADGLDTLIDDWIHVAGGVNAAQVKGNGRPVSLEQIIAWNPDVIIVGSAPNQQSRAAILADPRWSGIKAVRTGKVYANPSGAYLWDRHGAESALQVLWAAKLLHPQDFADLDVRRETKLFYSRFFHYTLTDAELRSIMNATAP
ncbi:MAG TPA: ABC transporter substrate-binding protein [Steroidobacteraceae bacterium]|nr:ABC transporter substrate-binding protein [Steroidobacteraceae bacterium]